MRNYTVLVARLSAKHRMAADLPALEEEALACVKRRYRDSILHPDPRQTTNRTIGAMVILLLIITWLIARDETKTLVVARGITINHPQVAFLVVVMTLVVVAVAFVIDFSIFYDVRDAQRNQLRCELLESYIYADSQRDKAGDALLREELTQYLYDVNQICRMCDLKSNVAQVTTRE